MNNQQNPECRDTFIKVVKTGENHPSRIVADRVDTPLDLSWEHDRRYDARDDVIKTWRWINHDTARVYDGWCLLYKPPRDVYPESVLGKLKQLCVTPDTAFENVLGGRIKVADLIDLIESQEQRVKELEARLKELRAIEKFLPDN
jgi:hypothetical protein